MVRTASIRCVDTNPSVTIGSRLEAWVEQAKTG
jgi:hypothetical protein